MQTRSWRRHRSTEAERRQLVEEYRRSGRTQREFAAEAGMGVSTLCAWLRGHPGKETSGGTGFVALPNLGVTVAAPRAYRLEFADPMVLEIPTGFGAQDLARLLGVLRDL